MWSRYFEFGSAIVRQIGELDRMTWTWVFFGVLVLGFICMRGFGSRSSY